MIFLMRDATNECLFGMLLSTHYQLNPFRVFDKFFVVWRKKQCLFKMFAGRLVWEEQRFQQDCLLGGFVERLKNTQFTALSLLYVSIFFQLPRNVQLNTFNNLSSHSVVIAGFGLCALSIPSPSSLDMSTIRFGIISIAKCASQTGKGCKFPKHIRHFTQQRITFFFFYQSRHQLRLPFGKKTPGEIWVRPCSITNNSDNDTKRANETAQKKTPTISQEKNTMNRLCEWVRKEKVHQKLKTITSVKI